LDFEESDFAFLLKMPAGYRHHFQGEDITVEKMEFCRRMLETLIANRRHLQTHKTYNRITKAGCSVTLNCKTRACPHKFKSHFDKFGDARVIEVNQCIPLCINVTGPITYCAVCDIQFNNNRAYLIHVGRGHI
jgi:hypothetical protein